MQIDRADMKLLIEAGYSGVMRGISTDLAPIFLAMNEWMPAYAAGEIGLALQEMTSGNFAAADERLTTILASDREGRDEARAILAMCKALQNQHEEARRLQEELQGEGGAAEAFTDLLVNGAPETTQGNQGLAMETEAVPARDGHDAERA
ncbi:hypothetical protein [Paracoccus laeviglucosivorans]|uniref:Tetratricopeptide repeat-containing protein n=1 Tax=Paracoccus laeviglucosivorans TaxID=1197861 RepID=A0A521BEY6_9RHOB|nr:hypothetical protein [Paracoccus laeviglucosivorans]SMO45668.1 hypothetical protein SAMN06265221_102264 [Paracoccus laeviglucosivorans]